MDLKKNCNEYREILQRHGIKMLYHFTDRENLESIIKNGGLYSWEDCDKKGISIAKPGGSSTSRDLDRRDRLQSFVRVCFTRQHPMMYVAMNDGRINNPVILEIDPEVVEWEGTMYADRNATKTGAIVGNDIDSFKRIHFNSVKAKKHFDLDEDEQPYYQAEVLVKHTIPLKYITNISNFGIPIPSIPNALQIKDAYTAQITRTNPTAFIFLIDHSVSMSAKTMYEGKECPMHEVVARFVNHQINELVLRCVKYGEVRHYYDIAVIGYGTEAYSAWKGDLEGRDFVSPEELRNNPYRKVVTMEEVKTRRGVKVTEVEKVEWIEPQCDGSWTHVHTAFKKIRTLLESWMEQHHDQDCYPPTIIHITDGVFNGETKENVIQLCDELKSMHTNDGNVLMFNIHIQPFSSDMVVCPINVNELNDNAYAKTLFDMSSLLPTRYNKDISRLRGDDTTERHRAMAVNSDMATLFQLMDIGTPTNISQNQ